MKATFFVCYHTVKPRYNEVERGSQLLRYNHYFFIASVHFYRQFACKRGCTHHRNSQQPAKTRTSERKKKKTQRIVTPSGSLWSFNSTRAGCSVRREKVLDRFLPHLLQAIDGFFSCSRDIESILTVIVSAKEVAPQVCRILVEWLEEHAGARLRARETRTFARVARRLQPF